MCSFLRFAVLLVFLFSSPHLSQEKDPAEEKWAPAAHHPSFVRVTALLLEIVVRVRCWSKKRGVPSFPPS
uniref:Putative secreted protein n=1 Tax=Anopheles marajoara TaxID=58244 RepID=A0A2M4CEP2_9DIPT